MFKTATELKKFIIWAKSQGLKKVKVGDIEVEISDISLIKDLENDTLPGIKAVEEKDSSKTMVDELSNEPDPEDLYWSAN